MIPTTIQEESCTIVSPDVTLNPAYDGWVPPSTDPPPAGADSQEGSIEWT
jgi:hypothetical protein